MYKIFTAFITSAIISLNFSQINLNSTLEQEHIPVFNELSNKIEEPVFKISQINDTIKNRIYGISYVENSPIALDDLRYLEISYYDFNGEIQIGEMIVNKKVASDVIDIFKELFEAKYPIDKIRLIDEYNADDYLSCKDNNTSGLCVRTVTDGTKWSNHSYGLAIDINPVQNPYIYKDGSIYEPSSEQYIDRSIFKKGMIIKGDPCYTAFTSRGWKWGGDYKTIKDYQHFEYIGD